MTPRNPIPAAMATWRHLTWHLEDQDATVATFSCWEGRCRARSTVCCSLCVFSGCTMGNRFPPVIPLVIPNTKIAGVEAMRGLHGSICLRGLWSFLPGSTLLASPISNPPSIPSCLLGQLHTLTQGTKATASHPLSDQPSPLRKLNVCVH